MRELTIEEMNLVAGGRRGGGHGGGHGHHGRSGGSYGYSGTLAGVTKGFDGTGIRTDCHYSTPVGGFTVSMAGSHNCDPTSPAPKGIGGSGR
jgi:hypothetical protein